MIKSINSEGNAEIKNLKIGKPDSPVTLNVDNTNEGQSYGVLAANGARTYKSTLTDIDIYANVRILSPGRFNCGGFIGYARNVQFTRCSFNGKIEAGSGLGVADPQKVNNDANNNYHNAAGFIGSQNDDNTSLTDCVNKADITTYCCLNESRAAGFVAYTGAALTMTGCVNYGNCSTPDKAPSTEGGTDGAASGSQCGGIIGHINGANVKLTECINAGNLTANKWVGGMVANHAKAGLELKDCANYGTYTTTAEKASASVANIAENITVTNTGFIDKTGEAYQPSTGNTLVFLTVGIVAASLTVVTATVIYRKKKKIF